MTRLGRLIKFVAVPGALAALGYFYIGPKLGGDIVQKARTVIGGIARAPKHSASPTDAVPETSPPSPSPDTSLGGPPEPEVKVTVHPANQVKVAPPSVTEPEKPRRRRRRRRRSTTPTEISPARTAPAESTPPSPGPVSADG
ncbi:hypothetical protein BH11ARM2_BH11ARM2_03170 [soil metagenome]